MSPSRLSRYTLAVSGLGLGLVAAVYVAVLLLTRAGLGTLATAVSDFGEAGVVLFAAVVVLRTALSFAAGEPVRRYWLLIGLAVTTFAAGDLIWSFIEVVQGRDTFPSAADVFYVAQYAFFCAGVMLAAMAYRHMVDVRGPLTISIAASLVLGTLLYRLLLQQIIADPETAALAKALSLFYPLADVFLAFLPALFIVLVTFRLGRGAFGRPWWPVAIGLALLALSDAGFAYLDWNGLYQPGHIVDAGWMLAQMSVAIGALVARDVFGVREQALDGSQAAA